MHDGKKANAALPLQSREELEDLMLVVQVEVNRRLVEEQEIRLLGQRKRDHDSLLLTAAELGELTSGQVSRIHGVEAAVNGVPIGSRERAQR